MGHLPVGNYRWLTEQEYSNIDWLAQSPTQSTGYVVECDLHLPEKFHDYFEQLPLAPERYNPSFREMSPFSQKAFCSIYGRSADRLNWDRPVGLPKLCSTFHDKTFYATHYLNLKYYLEKGYVLTKIRRVLAFDQLDFLKQYVAEKTWERANATSKAKKNLIKIWLNSLFGKTIEIGDENMTAKFIWSEKLLNRYTSDSRFSCVKVLGENCCIFYSKVKKLELKKPCLIGYCILEKSKLFMFRHYYERIIPALKGNICRIVFSDTDSFLIHCIGMSKLEFMKNMKKWSDYSNLPKSHPLYDESNASLPGYFKDETGKVHSSLGMNICF